MKLKDFVNDPEQWYVWPYLTTEIRNKTKGVAEKMNNHLKNQHIQNLSRTLLLSIFIRYHENKCTIAIV